MQLDVFCSATLEADRTISLPQNDDVLTINRELR